MDIHDILLTSHVQHVLWERKDNCVFQEVKGSLG